MFQDAALELIPLHYHYNTVVFTIVSCVYSLNYTLKLCSLLVGIKIQYEEGAIIGNGILIPTLGMPNQSCGKWSHFIPGGGGVLKLFVDGGVRPEV